MAIQYPLELPAQQFAKVTWGGRSSVAASESPFTYKQQVQENPGQRWEGTVEWPPLNEDSARDLTGFLMALNGRAGTFLMGQPGASTPLGEAATNPGSPVVNGASQTGQDLDIDGCPASVNGYLKRGDYIQIGSGEDSRLHMVIADADTDSIGATTLTLWPNLRESPSDNSPIIVSNARGVFRLAQNLSSWSLETVFYSGISLNVVEVI